MSRLVHRGCGGTVEWVDTSDIDEDYVCERCGAVGLDGEDLDVVADCIHCGPFNERIRSCPTHGLNGSDYR